jgi:carbamoyl-phosphate synthase large subunit
MKRRFNVLFSSAGRRVELMECFRRAARDLGLSVGFLAADCNPRLSPACHAADQAFELPRCTDPAFIPRLIDLCQANQVGLLVPTIDTELEVLSEHRQLLESAGVLASVCSPQLTRIARNKLETFHFLTGLGISSPRTAPLGEIREASRSWRFPLILKPVDGSSSIGIHIVESAQALEGINVPLDRYIGQEFSKGKEYTVNLFFDRDAMRCAVPHLRIETRGGEVSKALTSRVEGLAKIASVLNAGMKSQAFGALCFQAIKDNLGGISVFEINARFGGGYPIADYAGAPFAKWLMEIALGLPCSAHDNWREGVLMLRYDTAFFREGQYD